LKYKCEELIFPNKYINFHVPIPFHNSNVFKALFEISRSVKIRNSEM